MGKSRWHRVWALIAGLCLASLAGVAGAQGGTWSIVSMPQMPVQLLRPNGIATDILGNLYVADADNDQIWRQDPQGNWTVLATSGAGIGQVDDPGGLASDAAGNLYVADYSNHRVQKRDLTGNWIVLATLGIGPGEVYHPIDLATDSAGNLYVADSNSSVTGGIPIQSRIQQRDPTGNWTVLATFGTGPGQVDTPFGIATDAEGNLFIADTNNHRIQKRAPSGTWTVLATLGHGLGQVESPFAVATDSGGNLYVGEVSNDRIQRRDSAGIWTILPPYETLPGQEELPIDIATDVRGNLYAADWANRRILLYHPATPPLVVYYGDLDSDGKVTLADATLCLDIAVGNYPSPTPADLLKRADVAPRRTDGSFGDGTVSIPDVTEILRRAVGLESDPWP